MNDVLHSLPSLLRVATLYLIEHFHVVSLAAPGFLGLRRAVMSPALPLSDGDLDEIVVILGVGVRHISAEPRLPQVLELLEGIYGVMVAIPVPDMPERIERVLVAARSRGQEEAAYTDARS